jgi:hypothetical protein
LLLTTKNRGHGSCVHDSKILIAVVEDRVHALDALLLKIAETRLVDYGHGAIGHEPMKGYSGRLAAGFDTEVSRTVYLRSFYTSLNAGHRTS